MILTRSDLPLDRDSHSRFLPWLIAFMVFLAVLGLAGILVLNEVAKRWNTGVGGTVSIQIPVSTDTHNDELRLEKILKALVAIEEIESYKVIPDDKLISLLTPWLGNIEKSNDLPLPALIDVIFKSQLRNNTVFLRDKLVRLVPDITVDDHQVWLERLVNLIQTAKALVICVVIFIMTATIGTVVFTTQTGIAIHREAIQVLHLIGAKDSYIAAQFAFRALSLGLKGGGYGLALGMPPLFGMRYFAERMDEFLFPTIDLTLIHWTIIIMLPFVVAIIAMVTARLTVMRSLAKMV